MDLPSHGLVRATAHTVDNHMDKGMGLLLLSATPKICAMGSAGPGTGINASTVYHAALCFKLARIGTMHQISRRLTDRTQCLGGTKLSRYHPVVFANRPVHSSTQQHDMPACRSTAVV